MLGKGGVWGGREECDFFWGLQLTFWRLAQWRISEHKTVNTPQKLMEVECSINHVTRH